MKEILFRGKTKDGGWVYWHGYAKGWLAHVSFFSEDTSCEIPYLSAISVLPETVGMYTGFDDRDKVNIFEGDIVVANRYGFDVQGIVLFVDGEFKLTFSKSKSLSFRNLCHEKIIGNIHDNAELLEEVKK